MRGRGLLFAGVLILAAIAGGAVSLFRRSAGTQKIDPVRTAPAASPGREISLPGKIQARRVVPVGATAAGMIDAILVDTGQDVFEGQVLARISNQGLEGARQEAARAAQNAKDKVDSLESQVVAARLEASRTRADANRSRDQFERAEKAYLRQQMLNREGATPRLVYEKAQREYESARSEFDGSSELARQADDRVAQMMRELDSTRRALDQQNADLEAATAQSAATEIRSPVNGVVVARKADPGKTVGPEEARDLIEIAVDLAQLSAVVQPDPSALARIRPGMAALVYIADLPGAIPGDVSSVKGANALVDFNSPSPVIRPGMTAQVRLKLE